jgi:hypothetical protein
MTFRELLNRRLEVFLQKDESFKWENELRCVIDVTIPPYPDNPGRNWNVKYLFPDNSLFPIGYFIPVGVNTLIENLIVSPSSSDAFLAEVENLRNVHGLTYPIVRSKLDS